MLVLFLLVMSSPYPTSPRPPPFRVHSLIPYTYRTNNNKENAVWRSHRLCCSCRFFARPLHGSFARCHRNRRRSPSRSASTRWAGSPSPAYPPKSNPIGGILLEYGLADGAHPLATHRTIECSTSGGSPTFSEIDDTVSLFRRQNWGHWQKNRLLSGSLCTTLGNVRGADVALCGIPGQSATGNEIADALVYVLSSHPSVCVLTECNFGGNSKIKERCAEDAISRAGGKYFLNEVLKVALF